MKRREFIGWLAGAAAAWPLAVAAEGQPVGRMYRIGYLFEATGPETVPLMKALEEGLGELGYTEGSNLVIERRFWAFKYDRLPDLATELVRIKPDLVVTGSNPLGAAALKQATTSLPIVMVGAIDPVGTGLVNSLARPGGNVTGLSINTGSEFLTKLLARISHGFKRIGASNQRKLLCRNDFCNDSRKPRCRRSVAQNGLILEWLSAGLWKPRSMPDW